MATINIDNQMKVIIDSKIDLHPNSMNCFAFVRAEPEKVDKETK